MLIEVLVFALQAGVDEAAFLAADKDAQAELTPKRGFVRRTTARGEDGDWLVLTFWDAAEPVARSAALDEFIDLATARSERFTSLPG
jgi:hypothetical protein